MLVMIELKYVSPDKKSGILKYRRRIPKALQLALGKTEFVVSFKSTNHEFVLSKYDVVHNRIERELTSALEKSPEGVAYQATLKDLEKHSLIERGETTLSPYSAETDSEPNMRFASTLHKLAVAKGGKAGPETWDKTGELERLVTAQFKGLEKPRMTLREAQRVYIKAKRRKPTVARIDTDTKRVVEYLCSLMKKEDPFLWEIDREIARQFRDRMIEEGSSPATVMRRISS
jgi:hypothetical protein